MIKATRILMAILFVFVFGGTMSAQAYDIESGIIEDATSFKMGGPLGGKIVFIHDDDDDDDDSGQGRGRGRGRGRGGDDGCDDNPSSSDDVPCDAVGGIGHGHLEGIWSVLFSNIYISFNTQGTDVIGLSIDIGNFQAGFIIGSSTGSTVSFTKAKGATEFSATLVKTSNNQATVTVITCTPEPGESCGVFEEGNVLDLTKVF